MSSVNNNINCNNDDYIWDFLEDPQSEFLLDPPPMEYEYCNPQIAKKSFCPASTILLNNGFDPQRIQDQETFAALRNRFLQSFNGGTLNFKYLTQYPSFIHITTRNGDNLLHLAIKRNRLDWIPDLLQKGVNTTNINTSGQTPEDLARAKGYSLDKVPDPKTFQASFPQVANLQTTNKMTYVFFASCQDGTKKYKKCLEKDPSLINAQQKIHKNTGLHLAIKEKRWEVVDDLLRKGANRTIKNGAEQTPDDLAEQMEINLDELPVYYTRKEISRFLATCKRREGHNKLSELLQQHPELIDSQVKRTQDTGLHIAVRNGRFKNVEELLKRKANTDIVNKIGLTARKIAENNSDVKILALFINYSNTN